MSTDTELEYEIEAEADIRCDQCDAPCTEDDQIDDATVGGRCVCQECRENTIDERNEYHPR